MDYERGYVHCSLDDPRRIIAGNAVFRCMSTSPKPPEPATHRGSGGFFSAAAKRLAASYTTKCVTLALLAAAALAAAPAPQTFMGAITDDVCPNSDHSVMQMAPTNGGCALACVDIHGAALVLWDGNQTYGLSDQAAPQKFAGMKVKVTGTLDPKTKMIQVASIAAAK